MVESTLRNQKTDGLVCPSEALGLLLPYLGRLLNLPYVGFLIHSTTVRIEPPVSQ